MGKLPALRYLMIAIFAIGLVAVGGWVGSAVGAERHEPAHETQAITTQHDIEDQTRQDALTLRNEVQRQMAIFQQQLASVDRDSYSIARVQNRARTAWSNGSSSVRAVPTDSSMTVLGSPVVTPKHGEVYVWESPTVRGPAPMVTHENGWTVITPR